MGNLSYSFKEIIIVILAFIGTVIFMSFRWLGIALKYIGGGLFFLYMLVIVLPILILFKFKRFIENPKEFVKERVIETTQEVMED
ncbi:hypothetical protein [Campylobacter concisus]|uniref:hypothetical protein n=1 Tax=Campylobacter concisus TaxID=199 RepID=UPI000CD93063|nr:hypothetical protein [Campylobacter concisus]